MAALALECNISESDMRQVLDVQQLHTLGDKGDEPKPRRIGLGDLLELHGFSHTNKDLVKAMMKKDEDLWAQRPLPGLLLEYAAEDVRYLADVAAKQLGISSLSVEPSNPKREVVLAAVAACDLAKAGRIAEARAVLSGKGMTQSRPRQPRRPSIGRFFLELVGPSGVVPQLTPAPSAPEAAQPPSAVDLDGVTAAGHGHREGHHHAPLPSSDVKSLIAVLPVV